MAFTSLSFHTAEDFLTRVIDLGENGIVLKAERGGLGEKIELFFYFGSDEEALLFLNGAIYEVEANRERNPQE